MAEFRSLAATLRTTDSAARGAAHPQVTRQAVPAAPLLACDERVRDLALMRAAALEAFEAARKRVLQGFAQDVLARELALAPADIDALVQCALASFARHEPVTLVVSHFDAGRVVASLPVRIDPTLEAGDLIVEVRDGSLESRFAFRAEWVVERAG